MEQGKLQIKLHLFIAAMEQKSWYLMEKPEKVLYYL